MTKAEEMVKVEENTKLVHFIINKYFGNGEGYEKQGFSRDDLFQIGCVGLMHAVRKFDESLGFQFSTYAGKLIIFEIKKELTDKFVLIKYPREVKRIVIVISTLEKTYSIEDLIAEFDINEDAAKLVLECLHFPIMSLDRPLGGEEKNKSNDNNLADIIPSDYCLEDSIIEDIELKNRLAILSERERQIILLSLSRVTQGDIGKRFGITQVQVSRLIKNSVKKINAHFEPVGGVLS
jgi:RNA polymerase sigma factor (sigma-70 family)